MRVVSAIAVAALGLTSVLRAQTPAPADKPTGATIGFMHAIHASNDVDKTLAFYTAVFGLGTKVQQFPNPQVPILTNSPGVSLRVGMLRLPGEGFNFELTEFTNVERHPAQPRITDPGAPHMKLLVRDLEQVVSAARKVNAPVLTRGGAPVAVPTAVGMTKAIFLRDPDGYIVEAIQAPNAEPGAVAVVGSIMGETIGDMNTSLKFWRDLMGFALSPVEQWSKDKAMLDLMGLADGIEYRTVSGVVPGSKARIEFTEFKGAPKTAFDLRVPDPGASGMAIRVAEIQKLLPHLKSEGVRVISRNGELVEWSATVRNVFIKDPDGLNIEIVGDVAPPR